MQITGTLTGTAVTQGATDATADRVIRVQDGYLRGTVLGTVSQSGGVPTGAVIERGSNANGSDVRFADGTQICTHAKTLAYDSAARLTATGTFPASFAAAPVVTAAPNAADLVANTAPGPGGVLGVLTGTVATTWTQLFLYRPTGRVGFAAGNTATVAAMATGRWF